MAEFGASNAPVSLEAVLANREARVARQRQAMAAGRGTVVSFTVNMPGPIKDSDEARVIFRAGQDALAKGARMRGYALECLSMIFLPTGPEALAGVGASPLHVKRLTLAIEAEHPLGRFFDLDVLDGDGVSVSRSELGLPPRTCFVCGEGAAVCARSRAHNAEELSAVIREAIAGYLARTS